ncbi:hypothetical protein [Pseudanabaena sp. UWO310]|uniref:hypothetical protein n=1 Tax=Pseudanabaena sp. UWO310 TaxID=2480795 RepID=UPI001159D113|nr:hypothetical protein [Pseudanabaena sp. UWO310]TYQ30571.1 hypothetical protein PseudUWO310_08020 [Pseudanabaena sp. UWO310]
MSIEIVKPVIVDNVEFYVSADGTQSGVSQSGLARLCGVGENAIRKIIVNDPRTKTPSKALESFVGNVFHLALSSDRGAKFVTTEAATEIVCSIQILSESAVYRVCSLLYPQNIGT